MSEISENQFIQCIYHKFYCYFIFSTTISTNVSAPGGHGPGSSDASLAVRSPSPNFWLRHCLCSMSGH